MKTALLFVFLSVCLAQAVHTQYPYANFSLPRALLDQGFEVLREIAQGIFKVIQDGQAKLRDYGESSDHYADILKNNSRNKILSIYELGDKAITEARKTVAKSNGSVLNCFSSKSDEIRNTFHEVSKGVGTCTITQIKKFVDLGIEVGNLGNDTINFLLETKKAMLYCDSYEATWQKIGCVSIETGKATVKSAHLTALVALKLVSATSLMWTLAEEMPLCLQAKVGQFQQKVAEIPLNLAFCTGETVFG